MLFPKNFRRLARYIYPYVESASDVFAASPLPPPKDYEVRRPASPAGGGEGGNPSLWDVVATLQVTVTNTGAVAGAEVVQAYVGFPAVAGEQFPPQVLRGFEKVHLDAGAACTVQFNITRRELSFWDTAAQNWRMPVDDAFTISVGRSSRLLDVAVDF